MENNYKYFLEPYSGSKSRHECPNCGDKHSFTYYIDKETGETCRPEIGRCNHESSCGYHYKPSSYRKFGYGVHTTWGDIYTSGYNLPKPNKPSFFDEKHLLVTEVNHSDNNFVKFLLTVFDADIVNQTLDKYRIGTSNYWRGSTVFWYIDKQNRICSGKVMQYDKTTGERVKRQGIPLINSMRKILQSKNKINQDFIQKKSLFGEHLLVNNDKPVNIVESEKTAIICSLAFPENVWLATGGRSFLTKTELMY